MTAAQLSRQARRYLRKWQPRLGLQRFTVEVEVVPTLGDAADDPAASILYHVAHFHATIRLSLAYHQKYPDEVEGSVVHELHHLLLSRELGAWWGDIQGFFGADLRRVLTQQLDRIQERCIEQLTAALLGPDRR